MIQVLWLGAEAVLLSSLLLLLYRLRAWFGHAMLYVTLGALQYLQTVLATSTYVELLPGISISPGSAVLFSGSLLAVLLIYIREGLEEARRLIYSVVAANAVIGLICVVFGLQLSLNLPNLADGPAALFGNARVLFVGTLVLYLDVILTIVLYQAVGRAIRLTYLRILISLSLVLSFDTLLFAAGNFIGSPDLGGLIVSGIVGKVCAAVFSSAVLTIYLHRLEPRSGTLSGASDSLAGVFKTLTYRQRFEQLRAQMNHDALTGVFNRAFFDEALVQQLALAKRHGHAACLLMVDLDNFKQINDRHGHQAGDRVLIAVAGALKYSVRESDLVCRYGGEEFAVICPYAKLEQGAVIGEKLREAIAKTSGIGQAVAATIGIAEYPRDAADAEELIRHADRRLYLGKRGGRNRVVSSD